METYIVIIEYVDLPHGGGRLYGAFVPDVPGCTATGKSLDEALVLLRNALQAALRLLCKAGAGLPHAHSLEEHKAMYSVAGESLLSEKSIVAVLDVPSPQRQHFSRAA